MNLRIKLAFRNIFRHQLRSLLSILMIISAIISMMLFKGFSDSSLNALKRLSSENQYGHMQIANKKYWSPGKENRVERVINLDQFKNLKTLFPKITKISGRLSLYGLVSNQDLSVGAKIIGVDIQNENTFNKTVRIINGNFISDDQKDEVIIGVLLAKQLHITPGESITILANTLDGTVNALDLLVTGTFSAGIDEIDGQVIYTNLKVAQKILDTPNVDLAVIKFNNSDEAIAYQDLINKEIVKTNPTLIAKSWIELAVFFRQVKSFYNVQGYMVGGILYMLMFFGISNTVSMSVYERTGEIGTLRSLGESRKDIVFQFLMESLIIAIISIICSAFLSKLAIISFNILEIETEMPGASTPFIVQMNYLYSALISSSVIALIVNLLATIVPAMRAAKADIIESLRKNI